MDRDDERSLVARLRARDTGAFDEVYDEYRPRVFAFLLRLSRNRTLAEDLLDETWLRLVSHAPRLLPDTRIGPWLFTVARNLYASYCRSRLVEDSHAAGLIGLWPFGSPRPTPFESTAANETEHRLEAALAGLPVRYREALLLVAVEGLRPAEAADVCGVSSETMRQRLSRARALLASRMDPTVTPAVGWSKLARHEVT